MKLHLNVVVLLLTGIMISRAADTSSKDATIIKECFEFMGIEPPKTVTLLGFNIEKGLDTAIFLKIAIHQQEEVEFMGNFKTIVFEPGAKRVVADINQPWWTPATDKDARSGEMRTKTAKGLHVVIVPKGEVVEIYLQCI